MVKFFKISNVCLKVGKTIVSGNIVDVLNGQIYPGEIEIVGEKIKKITIMKTLFHCQFAGLMSNSNYEEVVKKFSEMNKVVHKIGTKNPFMILSFLSLLPIPKLRINDRGLFDVEQQKFIPLVC